MFQRIAMLISLTFFTACAGGMQSQNNMGLQQRQQGLGGLCLLGVLAAASDDGRGGSRSYETDSSSGGSNTGALMVGASVLVAGGLALLVLSNTGDVDGSETPALPAKPVKPAGPDYNVGTPDFIQAALGPTF